MAGRRSIPAILTSILALLFMTGVFKFPASLALAPVATMPVTHTVLFQFKGDAKEADVKAACDRFLALKTKCVHPDTKANYILSLKGGRDNSPENLQAGITHGFVVEFACTGDRDYYVEKDPEHQAFIKSVGSLVDKTIVLDFVNGVF